MIKNIIFDFGGVIYDIDHKLNKIAFENLGVANFDQLYGHQMQSQLFEDFEKGMLADTDFRTKLKASLSLDISDQQLDGAWCSLLLGVQKEKIDLLKQVAANYQMYLLSNTSIIHYRQYMKEVNVFGDFRSLFKAVYFSHEHGMRKPDPNFYLKLINEQGLKAEESLFIDDLDVNIHAASDLGLQTYYLQKASICDLFEDGIWRADLRSPLCNY